VTKPLIGAFGERAVECELLRRGWVTANVNASIRNVPDFDLFAVKQNRFLQIRVKTCSPGEDMQFSTPKNQAIITNGIPDTDFFVIVRMGEIREGDQFYVVPTRVVFQAIEAWRIEALNTQRDNGHWRLKWNEHRGGQAKPNYGFERKWEEYLNARDRLEQTPRHRGSIK
jgi:hypothetical protein